MEPVLDKYWHLAANEFFISTCIASAHRVAP